MAGILRNRRFPAALPVLLAVVLCCGWIAVTGARSARAAAPAVIATPPMGWASWNTFAAKINYDVLKAQTAYTQISDSIARATARTGRPMVFSVCNWGNQSPWNWAPAFANMWRTSQDIIYYGESASMSRMLANFDSAQHASAQSPGH